MKYQVFLLWTKLGKNQLNTKLFNNVCEHSVKKIVVFFSYSLNGLSQFNLHFSEKQAKIKLISFFQSTLIENSNTLLCYHFLPLFEFICLWMFKEKKTTPDCFQCF